VSVHSGALTSEDRRAGGGGPRLPKFSRAFWVKRSPASPSLGDEPSGSEGANGSSAIAEQGSATPPPVLAAEAAPAAAAAVAKRGSGIVAPGLANNIAAAPKLGILRLSRLAAHVVPPSVAARAAAESSSGIIGSSSAAEVAPVALATADGAAAEAPPVEAPAGQPAVSLAVEESVDASAASLSSALDSLDSTEGSLEPARPKKRRGRWRVPRPPLEVSCPLVGLLIDV
jgi:hypothetical protein